MATVVRRTIRSSPHRDTLATWQVIVDLLTSTNMDARTELERISGIAISTIADRACEGSGIIVSCNGPQTRFYCLFDDEAIDGSNANEDILMFDPLSGNWAMSLPCHPDDLSWVQTALKQISNRVTARDLDE